MKPTILHTALLVSLVSTSAVRADDATAKALFDQGKILFAEGKYGEACKKLEASFKMKELSGTGGLLGACYEKVGRLASAWSAYRDSAVMAEKQGNVERATASREKAAELFPKLAHVSIDVTAIAKIPKVKVTIDGAEQVLGGLGDPIPIDAGQHILEATAIDYTPSKQTIDIQDGENQKTSIPALVEDPTRRIAIEKRLADERQVAGRRKKIALGLATGGGVSLGVAATLVVLARSQWNHAKDLGCDASGSCVDDAGKRAVDGAALKADIATYVGGGGLLLLGAGVFIYVTSPKPHSETELRLLPSAGPGTAGLVLGGRF